MTGGSIPWRLRAHLRTRRVAASEIFGRNPGLGNGHGIEDMLAELGRGTVSGIAGRLQSVPGDCCKDSLDVVGEDARMVFDERVGFCRGSERECAARRQTDIDIG